MRHLLLATVEDPHNPKSWSGTPFNMRKALERNFERVSVLSSGTPQKGLLDGALRMAWGRQKYPLWMTRTALKTYAKRLIKEVQEQRPDAVLCISSQHLIYAGALDVPVYMISDAPWMAYKQAYQAYETIPLLAPTYARLEADMAKGIAGVIYPTPWACNEAIRRFGVDTHKVHLLPFGANSHCVDSDERVSARVRQRKLNPLRFLFIGKDWERKGGPLAVDVVNTLNAQGVQASLDVIGCQPALETRDQSHVRVLGYLSPDKPEDRATMAAAFAEADFFLVPSHAECFGLVFAEAQSYGLPCIALNSQGIPGVVDDQTTGLLFDASTSAMHIAQRILALIQAPGAYQRMALAARMKFTRELNWATFGSRIRSLITSSSGQSHDNTPP
ncbi:glycosyltransferase family 4 protein [Rhodoferax sp. GW822-FHT02A01]|uniref:glycosyltransferase family 4 protein n=1 Tax=Rhodoferax sp. GW822-FHT02A01 TaxID=3141537 RepID=UPI00315D64E7